MKQLTIKKQKGLVLLVLVIIIALAVVTYSFSGVSITQVRNEQSKNTVVALKEAKQALINYAITYSDRTSGSYYGLLPNPEVEFNLTYGDGETKDAVTGIYKNINAIGWLPWRTLDLENLKDDSGNCLLYAVSATYKFGPSTKADLVNEDSIGMFQIKNGANAVVQGGNAEDRIVALVFAPGAALPGQSRTPTEILSSCGRDYHNVSAYLDGNGNTNNSNLSTSEDQIDFFIHATATSSSEAIPYNDKFLAITREEIWGPIVKRSDFKNDMASLTRGLATCTANYANLADNTGRKLPWPTKVYLGTALSYRNNSSYDDSESEGTNGEGYAGRYPYKVDDSNNAIDPTNLKLTEDVLFNIPGMCSDVGNDWEGKIINLEDNSSKYGQLWNNWKDHFFYTISKRYAPDNSGIENVCDGSGECITVNTLEYAGTIIFSGSRLAGYTRTDKTKLDEYLEDGKSVVFSQEKTFRTGDRAYLYTDSAANPDTANDIMYCIQRNLAGTALEVVSCL